MTVQPKGKPTNKLLTSHRLICGNCHKTVCCVSYKDKESKLWDVIDDIVCEECDREIRDNV